MTRHGKPKRPVREDGALWCSHCQSFHPRDNFYPKRYVGKYPDGVLKDGSPALMAWCKDCCRIESRRRYWEERDDAVAE